MKKSVKRFFCMLLCAALFVMSASANSGPAYVNGAPAYQIAPMENCPVVVEHENLSFNFAVENLAGYSPQAQVTAIYTMKNTTDTVQTVQMVFPFISSVKAMGNNSTVKITENDQPLPFQLRFGQRVSSGDLNQESDQFKNLTDFKNILNDMSQSPSPLSFFQDAASGKRYKVRTNVPQGEIVVRFSADSQKTRIISTGFTGYKRLESGAELSGLNYTGCAEKEFCVLGEDITNLSIAVYEDGTMQKELTGATAQIYTDTVPVTDFLHTSMDAITQGKRSNASGNYDAQTKEAIYQTMVQQADSCFSAGQFIVDDNLFSGIVTGMRIMTFVYQVTFEPNSTKNVTVSYIMDGTMDSRTTELPTYTYNYLTNPAKWWADFGSLDICITPPQRAPYLVKSSLPFTGNEDGTYSATLDQLPEADIQFTLYKQDHTSPKSILPALFTPLLLFAVFIGFIVLISLLLKIGRRCKDKMQQHKRNR